MRERLPLSHFPDFLTGKARLEVPVFTVWGACEDVAVLEKIRSGEYNIPNLNVIDEGHTQALEVGDVKLRILGLGGALVMHKLFDNGEGKTTIAGGQGTMWTTLLQMGELINTANNSYDPTETRIFLTHASPAREGLLNQLSVAIKADLSISAGLHFRYGSSYNEFSVNPTTDHYKAKLAAARASFYDVWDTVKSKVEPAVAEDPAQNQLLHLALSLFSRMPAADASHHHGNHHHHGDHYNNGIHGHIDESAFKNMWNFNLSDSTFGWLLLDIDKGRIATEMRSQGFNFAHRTAKGSQRQMQSGNADMSGMRQQAQLPQQMQQMQQQQAQQLPHQQQIRSQRPSVPLTTAQIASQGLSQADVQQQPNAQPQMPRQQPQEQQRATNLPTQAQPLATSTSNNNNNARQPKSNDSLRTEQQEGPPSNAIYIPNLINVNQEAMKDGIFLADDVEKISKIDHHQGKCWVVYFESPEAMQDVLTRVPRKDGKFSNMTLRPYKPRGRGGMAGSWGSMRNNTGTQGGEQQSRTASGTENDGTRNGSNSARGRERGGFGRGRGGSERGDRGGRGAGNERGGRGGRGGALNKGGQSNKPDTPTTGNNDAAPAPAPKAEPKPEVKRVDGIAAVAAATAATTRDKLAAAKSSAPASAPADGNKA